MRLCKLAFVLCVYGTSVSSKSVDNFLKNNTLWVLTFENGLELNRLRSANDHEKIIFTKIIAPAIKQFQNRNSDIQENVLRGTEDATIQSIPIHGDNTLKLQAEVRKILNKFRMTYTMDIDNNDDSSTQIIHNLFFFGPYTSLIVNTGRQQLHYFIEPPSTLPNWFYQNHENVATINSIKYVDIPENVQYQFYEKFIDLLHSFFSFPI